MYLHQGKWSDALSQLDQNAREILMLVADGKSEKEIMEILKIPRGTVASRKSKSIVYCRWHKFW